MSSTENDDLQELARMREKGLLAGHTIEDTDGSTSQLIDILSVESLKARPDWRELRVLVIPKYAPEGTDGWVYSIKKINVSTVSLEPLNGGRGLRIDPFALAIADDADVARYLAAAADTAVQVFLGSAVTVAGDGWTQPEGTLYTVIALKGMTQVEIARLGGEGGRSWPKIPRSYLTPVTLRQVAVDTIPTEGGLILAPRRKATS